MESMGLTKAKAMSGEAAMLYSIDASSNKSKYYEMLIIESNAGYTLHKRWGRLGDSFRTDSKDFDDLGSAMAALAKVKRSKMRGSSKYRDAFDSRQHKTPDGKQLPKGQYPIGLSSNPGSWSNQNIQTCKPALQQLVTVIQEAINDAANEDMSGVVTDLQLANGYVSDLGTSSMANEIRKKIKAPLSRLTGMGRHKADPNKIVRELKTLSRYLSKQMSLCMTASVADRYKTAGSRITSKDLREVLGNGGNFDTWEEEEAALTELAHKLNHPRINARKASELLREANEILDGHGVEVIWINNGGASDGGPELSTRYGDEVGCEYVNTGDTYSATVLYDAQKQVLMVTTWGDWAEHWEQENLMNASRYA
tara:strand:- start:1337 stop:2437 length:1101 start_codon:yes stop_codon:yes gene_type:complete